MAIRLRADRHPRARALAAWTRELSPSRRPLAIRVEYQRTIPPPWASNVAASRVVGARSRSRTQGTQASGSDGRPGLGPGLL